MSKAQTKTLQQVVSMFLFYARHAIDPTMLYALNPLVAAQSKGTQVTAKALVLVHLLNYCTMHPDAKI
jgi:hypothetical protein